MPTTEALNETQMRWVGAEASVGCLWGQDDDGVWETSCGHAFEFNDGDPADNAFLFCPFCGRQIKTLVYEDEQEC